MYLHAVHRPPLTTACRGLSRTTSKIGVITVEDISKSVHAIILAGGSADNPLARYRAMPAVELGERPALQLMLMYIANMTLKESQLGFPADITAVKSVLLSFQVLHCSHDGHLLCRLKHAADRYLHQQLHPLRSQQTVRSCPLPSLRSSGTKYFPTAMPVQRKRALPTAIHTIS